MSRLGSFLLCLGFFAQLCVGPQISAQDLPPVRLKLEPLSIRNRSGAPVAVQIKLEYNQPQIMQGHLILELHDTLNVVDREDLLATIRIDDLVLAGTDYIFNAILPPAVVSAQKNLAIRAWFETDGRRYALSSSPQIPDPPEPFDLLMAGPTERGVLVCSCSGRIDYRVPGESRYFLQQSLSLDQYNPLGPPDTVEASGAGRLRHSDTARRILYHSASWSVRDLPEDPLSLCCFDLVLLADGALGKLSAAQMDGLQAWIAAGGGLCIYADEPVRQNHLRFVQTLLEGNQQSANFALSDDGTLLVISSENTPYVFADYGLGRVALINGDSAPEQRLTRDDIVELNTFVWHTRANCGIRESHVWTNEGLAGQLRAQGIVVEPLSGDVYRLVGRSLFGGRVPDDEAQIVTGDQLRAHFNVRDRFAPEAIPLVETAPQDLLPRDVEMVPTWVIGCILLGYVLAVGPVDYLVLGFFRIRKYTWIVFPITTLLFTVMTIAIAHDYMGSEDTGGSVTITDVADDGSTLRSSRLEMLFYGSRKTHTTEHRRQFVVAAGDLFLRSPMQVGFDYGGTPASSEPLQYSGHFPQSFQLEQLVQQWQPSLLRSFSIRPEGIAVPELDWSNPDLVTTARGRGELAERLRSVVADPTNLIALVLHGRQLHHVHGNYNASVLGLEGVEEVSRQQRMQQLSYYYEAGNQSSGVVSQILLATTSIGLTNYFGLVSQVAPQGSGTMEDLILHDPGDLSQWVLVIVLQNENDYEVWRRRYLVPPEEPGG